MKKFAAEFILSPGGKLLEHHTLVVNDNNSIVDLAAGVDPGSEKFEGILLPGFINAHCHLELSHLENKISPHKGLAEFIREFIAARRNFNGDAYTPSKIADANMWKNGIQGIGDICNTGNTFAVKKTSRVRYHNYIEIFHPDQELSNAAFADGKKLFEFALSEGLQASIIPHAPYTVPPKLFKLVKEEAEKLNSLWSMHNEESAEENLLFEKMGGKIYSLFNSMGFSFDWLTSTGKSSLQSVSSYFPKTSNKLLVHNTFVTSGDIDDLRGRQLLDTTWFCICPKANLYIENRLPDLEMLIEKGCRLAIGTDSLASNDTLSVLDEIYCIQQNFPNINIEKIFTAATANGAEYMKWKDLGSFNKGSAPGVLLVTGTDGNKITRQSSIRRLA